MFLLKNTLFVKKSPFHSISELLGLGKIGLDLVGFGWVGLGLGEGETHTHTGTHCDRQNGSPGLWSVKQNQWLSKLGKVLLPKRLLRPVYLYIQSCNQDVNYPT